MRKSTLSALGLAASAALTLLSPNASAQSGAPAPPPGFEGQAAPPPTYVPQTVAMSGPRRIDDWEEGEPIPPGYHPVSRIRKGLVIGGAVTFGVLYLLSAISGAVASDVGSKDGKLLFIPVVGPFTLLGSGTPATAGVFLVIDGLAQAAGVAMFVAGLAAPKTVLVRNDLGKSTFSITPTPMTFGNNSAGFGFSGKF